MIHKKTALEETERQLHSVEAKWIKNEINIDTYNRWYSDLNRKTLQRQGYIAELSREDDEIHMLLKNELNKLSDLRFIYTSATLPQKQELLRKGFDNSLYYKNGLYRTPYMMKTFHHSILILKEKRLLEMDENKKGDLLVPSSGVEGTRTPVQTYPSKAFYMFIPALLVGKQQETDEPIASLAG